jgi:hypothetical protein
MACTPLVVSPGLFINSSQGVWNNFNEAPAPGKSANYNAGALTVTGPNGTTFFNPGPTQAVKHRFFGTNNFMAVLTIDTSAGLGTRSLVIIDFTTPTLTTHLVLQVPALSTESLPFLQPSQGNGVLCCIGAASNGNLAGVSILRGDNGSVVLPGPPPFTPTGQVIGEATANTVQIKQGGTIIAGPVPFPAGHLSVSPASQTFATVAIGGCPQPPSTKVFTLTNTGNDCIDVTAIAPNGSYSVTATSMPLPADLASGGSMTVTVSFAPTAIGAFNNINLAITRNPPNGANQLTCSGQAVAATPSFTAGPNLNFGHILVNTTSAARTFTVTNNGQVPIGISVPGPTPGSPFQWTGFNGTLTCGASQPIAVTFTPTLDGPATQVTITVTGAPGGTHNVTLNGEGCVPNAVIGVPPAPFPAYAGVQQSYRMVRVITIGNTGDGPLNFTASLSGTDAALFGIMKPSNSITDVAQTLPFGPVLPVSPCIGAAGPGIVELAIVFFADPAHALGPATATLTIGNHNDPTAPPSFVFPLTANIVAGGVIDVTAVFDKSGSMNDSVPGGGRKTDAAVQAGKLLVQLIPPDLGNRIGVTRFSTTADNFVGMTEVTSANQANLAQQVDSTALAPGGSTAIAAGAMTALAQYQVPRSGPAPAMLTKSMVVLTDGQDNTAFLNPADNKYYTVEGITAGNPTPPPATVSTNAFAPPSDVKVYAVGLGVGQDIDIHQLQTLSTGGGGQFLTVDPTSPLVVYELMKYFTQIYMGMVDFSTISDPHYVIYPGQVNVIEFDLLRGDVGAMVVLYDLHGIRLPFFLMSPGGETVDASFVPPGFQLRSGFTDSSRFLDFRLPQGEPSRYAGRWKVLVRHDGLACRGRPVADPKGDGRHLGFVPRDCGSTKSPIEYGIAIGAGSNFRLQPYVTPGPVNVGDPILLTGVVTEAGLPVTGCTVTAQAVSPNGQSWNLALYDDGAHQDGAANDGEYAARFTQTATAGSYTFTFRATGRSHDNEPVTREAVLSKYVNGQLKPPPPGGGQPGGDDACCARLLKLIEEEIRLLERLVDKRQGG